MNYTDLVFLPPYDPAPLQGFGARSLRIAAGSARWPQSRAIGRSGRRFVVVTLRVATPNPRTSTSPSDTGSAAWAAWVSDSIDVSTWLSIHYLPLFKFL